MDKKYFIIDFDSTFIKTEGIEELASVALANNPKKAEIINKIAEISHLGMIGELSLTQTLKQRIQSFEADKSHLSKTAKILLKKISKSVLRNKKFFKKYASQIYIISGGFKELVWPVVKDFGIAENHVLTNEFVYNSKGKISGFDTKNPLSKDHGKAAAVKALKLEGEIIVIGDGITDYQIKELGEAHSFIYFGENVIRTEVHKKADKAVKSFDEFLYMHNLPRTLSYPKSRIKALLLENIEKSAVEILEKEGYQVELLKTALDEDELIQKIKDISVLGIRSKTKVTRRALENAKKLKVIGTFSIGTDQMDLNALTSSGIAVFNAPFQNTRSVVELAIGDMILLMRGAIEKNNKLHRGIWDKSAVGSNEIRGKTLGIIGYGNIGSQLSVLAENLGMDVIFYDQVEKLALGNAKRMNSLKELLKTADVISVHVSGDRSNTNIISEKEFEQMKDGVIFLNLSRGFVADIKALVKFLKNGKIRGAGLDVFPSEPKNKGEPFKSELQNLPNVLMTPHIAGSTEEAQKNIAEFVSGKIIDFMNTGNTYLSVNMPNIQLPEQGSAHRLLHLHKNVPGVLAAINNVLATHGINILGQYLKTNEEVGYVITDVNRKYDAKVLKELKKIPDTISFRVLY